MPITFTAQQRLDITRRQLRIPQEIAAYEVALASLIAQKAAFFNVDLANSVFYNFWQSQVSAYELEGRALNGTIAAAYTDGTIAPFTAGDLSSSAQTPGATVATFFPNTPPYTFSVPKQINAIQGFFFSTGTDPNNELTILTNLLANTNYLFNGISSGAASTTTMGSVSGGPLTAFSLAVTSETGFSTNDYIYLSNGGNSGIYQIVSTSIGFILINSILPSTSSIASGASVHNAVAGFNEGERESLTSGSYQEILTNLTIAISADITAWQGVVQTQITQLGLQQETRATQIAQNAAALVADNAALAIINTWLALSNTGVNGKYADNGINPVLAEITVRQAYIPIRIAQIITALGSVTVTGNVITGVVGSPYFERYKWLNIGINTMNGSARRYFSADAGIAFLQMLIDDDIALLAEYNLYFDTKAITFNDATTIIQVTDTIGLFIGDIVTVVSETQPELTRAIMDIQGTTQLKFDLAVPNTYLVADLARVFKTL